MDDLVILNVGITGIKNLNNFPYLPKLKVLNLKMNHIKNLYGLEKQTELTDIILWGSDIDDIEIPQIDLCDETSYRYQDKNPKTSTSPSDLIYMIYTSGTTVMIFSSYYY